MDSHATAQSDGYTQSISPDTDEPTHIDAHPCRAYTRGSQRHTCSLADLHAIPHLHTHTQPNGDEHRHAYRHPHADADQHGDRDIDAYRDPHFDANADADTHHHADGYPVADGHRDAYCFDHAHGHNACDPGRSARRKRNCQNGGNVKRRRVRLQLSDRQQLVLALVMVLLLAISMLYCLGFASITLRDNLERAPLPWTTNGVTAESIIEPPESVPSNLTVVPPGP